jgi:hypothetical protein
VYGIAFAFAERIIRSRRRQRKPYTDTLEPMFNLNSNGFPCMAKYEFSSRTCQNNSQHPPTS